MNELLRRILFLPEQASTFAQRVDALHYFVISVTMVASTLVGLVALFFLVHYRRRPGREKTPRIEPRWWFEVLIITVPASLFLTWAAIGFRDFAWSNDPPRDALDVYVTGKQWMWEMAYPDGPSGISVLRVPQGRPVRLLITSRDVIHSFFVPAFRVKRDAVPGRYTEAWFTATKPGRFPILCAEYCGALHSQMRGEVIVMPLAEFEEWLQSEQRGLAARQDGGEVRRVSAMAEQGRLAATQRGCLKCHSVDGATHIGPTFRGLYRSRRTFRDGRSAVADEAYLTRSMMDPEAEVVEGFSSVMPSFQGQLSAPEAAAIVEFIKALAGTGAGAMEGEPR